MQQESGAKLRRLVFRILLPVAGVLAGLAIGEGAVRARFVTPTRQIVRGHALRDVNGVPVWENETADARENRICIKRHPDRLRVLFFGNSITAGAGLGPKQTFTYLLERQLNTLRPNPGFCVMNFAEPGFHPDEQYALATEMIPQFHPAIVLNQDGPVGRDMHLATDGHATVPCHPWQYKIVGDAAYEVNGLRLRADGFPGFAHIPDETNRWLFQHSLLYQYLTLAHGEPAPEKESETEYFACREQQFMQFVSLARANGAKPAYYLAADLSYPMNAAPAVEKELQEPFVGFGQQNGFPVIELRQVLADQDHDAIKLDDWHLNAAGHKALAERFAPIILDIVDGKRP